MFNLSLILGGIQIIFGMILKAVNQTIQLGFKYAVARSDGFWYLSARLLPLLSLPVWLWRYGTSGAPGYRLADGLPVQQSGQKYFVNIGLGLWDSYNMATGLLGDVLSLCTSVCPRFVRRYPGQCVQQSGSRYESRQYHCRSDCHGSDLPDRSQHQYLYECTGCNGSPMRLTFVEFFKNSGYEGGRKRIQTL